MGTWTHALGQNVMAMKTCVGGYSPHGGQEPSKACLCDPLPPARPYYPLKFPKQRHRLGAQLSTHKSVGDISISNHNPPKNKAHPDGSRVKTEPQ
jgi:hypothetical protein